MISDLKEAIQHGTREYPYEQYNVRNRRGVFIIPAHWHDEMEIIAIERGRLELKINSEEYTGLPGDLFFANPREIHLMSPVEIDSLYHTLLFPLEFISFQTVDSLESELLAPIRSGKLLFPNRIEDSELRDRLNPFIYKIIDANLKNEQDKDRISLTRHHLNTRIQLLHILECMYDANAFVSVANTAASNLQREMLAYIQDHYQESLTLSSLAAQFHLTEKYISRFFSQNFNLPFSSYIIHLRLSNARHLLETSDDSITDIALQSGFPNVSYFIRSFKKLYGTSPLQYRKKKST